MQVGKRGIGKETVEFRVRCPELTVSFDGNWTHTGLGNTLEARLTLDGVQLRCERGGLYRGTGTMTATGREFGSKHRCTGTFNVAHPVTILARRNDADRAIVNVRITPQEYLMHDIVITCPRPKRTDTVPLTDGFDMWGRLMANHALTLGRPTVITEAAMQGGNRHNTTITLTVTEPATNPQ